MRYATAATTYWTLAAGAGLLLAATGADLALADRQAVPTAALAGLLPLPVFLVLAAVLAAVLAGTAARFLAGRRMDDAGVSRPRPDAGPVVGGAVAGATLALLTLTAGLLAFVGYLPIAVVMAPFHDGMRAALGNSVDASLVVQLVVVAGVLLWGRRPVSTCGAARPRCRRGRGPSPQPGGGGGRWPSPSCRRWRTRSPGSPGWSTRSGSTGSTGRRRGGDGSLLAGVWLGAFAVVGALLTLGLVQRWGEVVPSWVPVLGGRRVPPAAAVVPATFVSVVLVPAGISMTRQVFGRDVGQEIVENWAAAGPTFLWPVWGLALGAATLAYALRRAGEGRASVAQDQADSVRG
ncbi:hypothetical protein [Georgenia sp. SUBG003]|uniref:hypothetical protein n=1 Tax=Georgenia sp. SUBG003 TaxID=1497974 RepID=UPI000693AB3C